MLDLMEAPAAAVIIATTPSAITATATATATAATCAAAAIRPSSLLPSSAAHNHKKSCEREQVVAKVAPKHHISFGEDNR